MHDRRGIEMTAAAPPRRRPLVPALLGALAALTLFAAGYLLAPAGSGHAVEARRFAPLPSAAPPRIALPRPLRTLPPLPAPPRSAPAPVSAPAYSPAAPVAAPAPAPQPSHPSSPPLPPVPSCIGPDC
ncbi:MAG: hypothetical protein JSS99_10610 [Actinobacteria bacterium]|nr:hypothetical protein [Actinomycetota bacterium]